MSEVKYVTTSDFILRRIGEESVLVPIGDVGEELENSMISFNETYSFIWQQFQKPSTVDEVIEAARKEYEDPEGVMERHIREASQELVVRKILKAV